jgi:hypothetical protein
MTAEHSGLQDVTEERKYSPCKKRFSQIQCIDLDGQLLSDFCQIHECNGFCLRSVKVEKRTETTSNGNTDPTVGNINVSTNPKFFRVPGFLHNKQKIRMSYFLFSFYL